MKRKPPVHKRKLSPATTRGKKQREKTKKTYKKAGHSSFPTPPTKEGPGPVVTTSLRYPTEL
jgi:hypothetical protein